jgi:hypothetical protein
MYAITKCPINRFSTPPAIAANSFDLIFSGLIFKDM